jgi:pimeloyl-ACP methyl ester carboxylesterase
MLLRLIIGAASCGCSQPMPDRAERMPRAYVYYLDGAGGGGLISNWAGGVKQGLLDAGYEGAGEIFRWNTGLGIVADQMASVDYKQGKARELAREIEKYQTEYPNAPITLVGLSAGTAVVAYALEALPPDVRVDTVIMLSGSLGSEYDLTRALRHVRGRMYVFTSERDEVLTVAVPLVGTADRESAAGGTIGTVGPRPPRGATSETRELYRKISKIPWNESFMRYGDYGRHTDTVKAPFVQAFVAPLVMKAGVARAPDTMLVSSAGRIANPDFQRWSRFPVGSWAELEGFHVVGGKRQPLRMKATLESKSSGSLVIHREFSGPAAEKAPLASEFFVVAQVDPRHHPLTDPLATVTERPSEAFAVGGRNVTCQARTVFSKGVFPAWGENVRATVWSCPDIPGGIVQIQLTSVMKGKPTEIYGRLVDFRVGAG